MVAERMVNTPLCCQTGSWATNSCNSRRHDGDGDDACLAMVVRNVAGKEFHIQCHEDCSMSDVKVMMEANYNIKIETQKFYGKGGEKLDNYILVSNYAAQFGHVIFMTLRMRGGPSTVTITQKPQTTTAAALSGGPPPDEPAGGAAVEAEAEELDDQQLPIPKARTSGAQASSVEPPRTQACDAEPRGPEI